MLTSSYFRLPQFHVVVFSQNSRQIFLNEPFQWPTKERNRKIPQMGPNLSAMCRKIIPDPAKFL